MHICVAFNHPGARLILQNKRSQNQDQDQNCDRTNFWLTKIEVRANKSEISNAAILTTTMLEAPSMTKKCM